MGVEPVGVEDEGDLGPRDERAGEGEGAVAAAQPGTDDECAAAAGQLENLVDAVRGVSAVIVGQAAGHRLQQALREDRLLGGGDAGGDVACARALRGLGGQRRRAGEARASRRRRARGRW